MRKNEMTVAVMNIRTGFVSDHPKGLHIFRLTGRLSMTDRRLFCAFADQGKER